MSIELRPRVNVFDERYNIFMQKTVEELQRQLPHVNASTHKSEVKLSCTKTLWNKKGFTLIVEESMEAKHPW